MTIALLFGDGMNVPAQEPLMVRGRVVRADDPSIPLARVRIALAGTSRADRVFTDDQGRFEIAAPLAGTTLTVSKPLFVTTTLPLRSRGVAEPLEIPLVLAATVAGRVIDPAGQPVRLSGVRVRPVGAPRPTDIADVPVNAVTNDRGEFRVGGLAPGRYQVSASFVYDAREQFADDIAPSALLVVGVARPSPQPVDVSLEAGQEVLVTLNQQEAASAAEFSGVGAVTGVVVDDFGDPLQGLRVRLWQGRIGDGRRVIRPLDFTQATDDRGEYRVYGLAPGRYFVSVDDPAGVISAPWFTADTPVFYPQAGTPAQALEFEVGPQQDTAGINVVFRPSPPARIRGFVLNAAGQPYRGNVTLAAALHPGEPSLAARTVVADGSGAFLFDHVAPGDYVVRVLNLQGASPGARNLVDGLLIDTTRAGTNSTRSDITEFGAQRVTVSGDDPPPITVTTARWPPVSGRIVFEGRPFTGDPSQLAIIAVPDDPDMAPGVMQASMKRGVAGSNDLMFEFSGVSGPVRLVVKAPAPWWLTSVQTSVAYTVDDVIDVTTSGAQSGLTLRLADTAATVSGSVRDDNLQPDNVVILFATDERRWFIRSPYTKISEQGANARFTLAGIPPGEYFITAVDLDHRQRPGEWWTDREALLTLAASAQRIKLSEGQSFKTNLRLVPAPP